MIQRKYILVFIALLAIALIVNVSAINLKEGTTRYQNTQVSLIDGSTTFTDLKTGLSGTTTIKIDGERFTPSIKTDGYTLTWASGEKDELGLSDPAIKMIYYYDGRSLKESITIKEDKVLSFPVYLGENSKLIPWEHEKWKIVSATSGDTMNGIVIEKPFGVDAAGHKVEMNFKYTGSSLDLTYDKTIDIYDKELTEKDNEQSPLGGLVPRYKTVPISYPLTIDPTWTSVSGCWTYSSGGYTYVMWNATGITTYTIPGGVTNLDKVFTVGGGGAGSIAGGGSGYTATGSSVGVTPGDVWTITVGDGGIGANWAVGVVGDDGDPSSFVKGGSSYSSNGGKGAQLRADNYPAKGGDGGSGGGGYSAGNGGTDGGNGFTGEPGTGQGAPNAGRLFNNGANPVEYAGGGGGGEFDTPPAGTGGVFGGGDGGADAPGSYGVDGTGGGGGGTYGPTNKRGGDGGCGVVIIRYYDLTTYYDDPLGYILADGSDNKLNFYNFKTAQDGEYIGIIVSGSYEVA